MQNRTGLVLCALTLLVGFLMICLGAFFISSDSIFHCQKNLVLAYLLLPLGFVMLLSGIFWSTYQQASKSKGVFSHVLRQYLAHRDLPLATVDRPDFYPPAYEESVDAEKQALAEEVKALDAPPPLYTETGLELKDENKAHPEAPPSYQESMADLVAAVTSEDTARPSPELKAGHAVQHAGCTFVGLSSS
ncbi:hypothetical protein GW7_05833 [Heterocephalus glaber]|uniref:Transmembrane protein 252 n=1 Tax=Heterocephalus glaber TaxID=10181 RepID=G5BXE5_HETGA|nr:transmembrane protein 252 [Heterocephalus glaber]EHB13959.1 hypothetical protein GW7_05833 [Heterocephalus glaber]